MKRSKIAVIGAGVAGVGAARRLVEEGCEVEIFEKSRGFGGRCASRRWEGCVVDHGAQYWTMRDEVFRTRVQTALFSELGRIRAPILERDQGRVVEGDHFYHRSGNSRLVRTLAEGLTVHLETLVVPKLSSDGRWQVAGKFFDRVIATVPLPQVKGWFQDCPSNLDSSFAPCLAAWFLFQGQPDGMAQELYAIRPTSTNDLAWTACENHKEGRVGPEHTLFVAHATEAFSRLFWDEAPELWTQRLLLAVCAAWEVDSAREMRRGWHRWRYARAIKRGSTDGLPAGLECVGDGIAGHSRVETAWLSGYRVELG
ncbi:MAG: FAD-dependent oxidoreductase [Candidatus Methylacidiphilales bacterium]